MGNVRATFRDLNTERDKNALPSGTSDIALNVVIDGTTLKGREGFGAWNTSGLVPLNAALATFSDGVTYMVIKATDGFLYWMLVDSTPSDNTWTKITDKFVGHDKTDRGWFYFWADRLYFSDRNGVTKWYGPTPAVWKAGIGMAEKPKVEAAATGGKEGYYHVAATWLNTATNEEGLLSLASEGALTYLSEGNGALTIEGTEWTALGANTDYEYDQIRIYCTLGNTEFMGLGDGTEVNSGRFYLDYTRTKGANFGTAPAIGKPDFAQDRRTRIENTGTEPIGSRTGFFNGGRAVYMDVYPSGTSTPGQFVYSLPDIPTMIPLRQLYGYDAAYDDTTTFFPRPYEGHGSAPLGGAVTGCGAVGSAFVVFTPTQTFWLLPSRSGALQPVIAHRSQGCMSECGCVTTPNAVHALGNISWLRVARGGMQNIARYRFTPTLKEIPAGQRAKSVSASFSDRDEIWMAVVKSGGTKATRILIWDEGRQGLTTIFEPANLGSAGIVAMCELSTPDHEPQMLIVLDNGKILNYPDGTFLDGSSDAYACTWRGYFAQEKRHQWQRLCKIHLHMGDNNGSGIPADVGISLESVGLRTSGQDLTASQVNPVTKKVTKQDEVDHSGVEFNPNANGNLFRIQISSSTDQGAAWEVVDMILDINKVE